MRGGSIRRSLHDPEARNWLLNRKVTPNELGVTLSQELRAWLGEMDVATLWSLEITQFSSCL